MELCAEGLQLHDRLMRELMGNFYGYEVSTEGDAFLVAFHEPFDAVAWCLGVQLALHCECGGGGGSRGAGERMG